MSLTRPRIGARELSQRVCFVKRRRGIPDRRVVILRAAKGIEQLLAVRSARTLLLDRAARRHQIHPGKPGAKVPEKLGQFEIGQP